MAERRKKRKYVKRVEVKISTPPADRMVRQCDHCLKKTDSVYCPNCGKVTIITK